MIRRPARRSGTLFHTAQEALIGCTIASLLAVGTATVSDVCSWQFGPEVGDLIRLRPGGDIATDWMIPAQEIGSHRPCTLRPAAMADPGGSLVVERRSADGWRFQVLWAGGRTSDGTDNCGGAAELELTEQGLWSLAQIGDAITPRRLPGF